MVKGVNKTVIEVNNTGSKIFEKIVFYVTPQYGNLGAKRLQKAASEFTLNFEELGTNAPLRTRFKKRRRKKRLLGLALFLGAVALAVLLCVFL
ncbi:MAG: hypothetical protein E7562_06670 [Ruminococcaceae bacterium]|nr:hypothetical protein [Oscillospiraceae bacterium]